MRAVALAGPHATLSAEASAIEAAAVLARLETNAALVTDPEGGFLDVVSDEDLVRRCLPSYVGDADVLARVMEEGAGEQALQRLGLMTVADLLPRERPERPIVENDATLVEVASVMVRAGVRLVAVLDERGRLIGGISMDELLTHLIPRR